MNTKKCLLQVFCTAALFVVTFSAVMLYAGDSPKNFKPADFPGPVFQETSGYIVIEAESVPLSSKWSKRTDAPGNNSGGCGEASSVTYTGSGYMRWDGSSLTCKLQNQPEGENNSDINQACQGSKSDWMVFKIQTSNPGTYTMKARVYHLLRDGDNDWWGGYIGMTGAIERNANCHIKTYSWPDWTNAHQVKLVSGLNAVYIAGRSKGIGIDRVAVYKGSIGEAIALNTAAPESKQVNTSGSRSGGVRGEPEMTAGSQGQITFKKNSQGTILFFDESLLQEAEIYSVQGRHLARVCNGMLIGSLPDLASRMAIVSVKTTSGEIRRIVAFAK